MRLRRSVPLAVSCAAVLLTGCGGSSSLLDGSTAEELRTSLASVQDAVDTGKCSQARSAVRTGLRRVDALPSSVDSGLRNRLQTGFEGLRTQIGSDCETTATTPTTTATTEPAPATTDEAPETTDTVPEDTTTSPTTTDEAPSTDTTTTDPDTTGGTGTGDDDGLGQGDQGSGGVTPDTDDSGAVERGVERLRDQGRHLGEEARRALRDARERAERAARGQG